MISYAYKFLNLSDPSIPPFAALTVVGLSFIIALLINDPIKVWLLRKFWQR